MTPSTLVAIPVYNEERHALHVLSRVLAVHPDVLVVDDGSTDRTRHLLPDLPVEVIRHSRNRGYGASLSDAFRYAIDHGFEWVITMDCDEQHDPGHIPMFLREAARDDADILSGSRYLLPDAPHEGEAPQDRRFINKILTDEINDRLAVRMGTRLTDAFCGFKAYRTSALRRLRPTVTGYAFPMQFWVQAAAERLRVREVPVTLIYNDMTRRFGGGLDDPTVRLAHYRMVLRSELAAQSSRLGTLDGRRGTRRVPSPLGIDVSTTPAMG